MINITIDGIVFEVWGDRTLWSPPQADGQFVEAPQDWAKLARALVMCDYEDRDERTYVAGDELHEHFIDTHDDKGNKVPEGRASGIHFPLKAGMPPVRAKRVMTGKLEGKPIISVLEWDDPLNAVMTAKEIAERYGVKEDTVRDARQNSWITARRSGTTWLFRAMDAARRWA